MTPAELEARLIAYGVAFLLLVGGAGWGGYTIAAHHYQRLELIEKDAQNTALQEAQRNIIAAQAAQKSAEDRANVETIARQKADTDSRNAVLGSVRGLEAAIHLGKLSAAVDHSGAVPNSAAVAGSDLATSRSVERLNSSIERAIDACQSDADHLAFILSIAPKVKP